MFYDDEYWAYIRARERELFERMKQNMVNKQRKFYEDTHKPPEKLMTDPAYQATRMSHIIHFARSQHLNHTVTPKWYCPKCKEVVSYSRVSLMPHLMHAFLIEVTDIECEMI